MFLYLADVMRVFADITAYLDFSSGCCMSYHAFPFFNPEITWEGIGIAACYGLHRKAFRLHINQK